MEKQQNLIPQPSDDPKDPLNWSQRKKYVMLAVTGLNAFMGPLSTSIYIPAILDVENTFNTGVTVIDASISVSIVCLGIGPLFWAPLSERIGRKWVYVSSMTIYTVSSIICGISNNLGLFFVFRMLQIASASAPLAVGAGTVADLFFIHERGQAMGLLMLGSLVGPTIGPIIGGYVNEYLSWRWIFYLLTIIGGFTTLTTFVFMRETLYHRYILPGPNSVTLHAPPKASFNPAHTLGYLLRPNVFLSIFCACLVFGWMYLMLTINTVVYILTYNFTTGEVGLTYLASGIGNLLGVTIGGKLSDILLARMFAKRGERTAEMRLRTCYFGIGPVVFGYLMYGWFAAYHFHWVLPLVGIFIMSFGMMLIFASVSTYLVDSYHAKSASVTSSFNFFRCLLAAITPLFAAQMDASLGEGWTFTIVGLTSLVSFIGIPLTEWKGQVWREKYEYK